MKTLKMKIRKKWSSSFNSERAWKKYQVNVWRKIVGSKRKGLIGALSAEKLKVLKMLYYPQK